MDILLVVIVALALDLAFGEPPNRWHPVSWLGGLMALEIKLAPARGTRRQLVYGGLMVLITSAALTAGAYFLFTYLRLNVPLAFIVLGGVTLKLTFSLRGLGRAARAVRRQVAARADEDARRSLRSLVSRDTTELGRGDILGAAVASVAENSCDSFTAPLLYFLVFGLPGAVAYRVVNTFDAMVGYHGRFEYLGKAAARLDDVLNFVPARLTALTLVAAAWVCRGNARGAWRTMRRDHGLTPSPNAGWTMSAVAGALEIKLEKSGEYSIGGGARTMGLASLDAARRLLYTTALIWSLAVLAITTVVYALP